ncbi:MAG: GFA family protein [Alphaproteobacteria bacterium]|nr:GFA family protein [Alphaproteobacteria bacterium]
MSERQVLHTGGCQCGAVRYALYAEPVTVSLCHCRMCQKALGAMFGAFAGVPEAEFAWTRGAPAVFRSSSEATRGFCKGCGTPLYFAYDGTGRISLTTGSFDDPEKIVPKDQIEVETTVSYFHNLTDLPLRGPEPQYSASRTEIATTNRQHPDHDTEDWQPPKPDR